MHNCPVAIGGGTILEYLLRHHLATVILRNKRNAYSSPVTIFPNRLLFEKITSVWLRVLQIERREKSPLAAVNERIGYGF